MGYSCAVKASLAEDAMIQVLKETRGPGGNGSNTWGDDGEPHHAEVGREQRDGAVVGTVWAPAPGKPGYARKKGTYRVEPDGKVTRWPGTTAAMRAEAERRAAAEFARVYGRARTLAGGSLVLTPAEPWANA